MTYEIHEAYIEKLEKKLTTIRNKCEKYGCTFAYERQDEIYKEVTDDEGTTYLAKFIRIYAEGIAVINDWRFVAVLQHTASGNIIRQYDYNLDVPAKYRTAECRCEHCNTSRRRNDTYLVYNDLTGEWKQVGKTCLKDFTGGLDADQAARYMSYMDVCDEYQHMTAPSCRAVHYYPIEDLLCYGVECVKHWGYVKSDSYDYPTGWRAFDYYSHIELGRSYSSRTAADIEKAVSEVNFNAMSDENKRQVSAMMQWILEEDSTGSDYFHNLQVLVKDQYIRSRSVPILVSLVAAYNRHIKKATQDAIRVKKHEAEAAKSQHVGQIKDKVEIDVAAAELVTSWDNQFGWSGMYKFTSVDGNVFIWITSCGVECDKKMKLRGTVKDHSEFNGVKQTILTRCKIEYLSSEDDEVRSKGEPYDYSWMDL